jgi:hypothetical protein
MTTKLKTLIHEVQELSPSEQLELIHIISLRLARNFTPQQEQFAKAAFWKPKTLEEIVQSQNTPTIENIDDLAVDFWPKDESVDDFIDYIYSQRHEDRWRD